MQARQTVRLVSADAAQRGERDKFLTYSNFRDAACRQRLMFEYFLTLFTTTNKIQATPLSSVQNMTIPNFDFYYEANLLGNPNFNDGGQH